VSGTPRVWVSGTPGSTAIWEGLSEPARLDASARVSPTAWIAYKDTLVSRRRPSDGRSQSKITVRRSGFGRSDRGSLRELIWQICYAGSTELGRTTWQRVGGTGCAAWDEWPTWSRGSKAPPVFQAEATVVNRSRVHALVAALVLSLTAAAAPADPAEDEAAKAVVRWGGSVTRDEDGDTRPVIAIDLGRSQVVTDAELGQLGHLRSLRMLDLDNTSKISDAGMKALKEVKSLRSLRLWGVPISDAGLKDLRELPSLRELDLTNTSVTDAGVKTLRDLPRLETLRLAGSMVTDEGLKQLGTIKTLRSLDLTRTRISDDGVKELENLPGLRALRLAATPVTDDGVNSLATLTTLRELHLSDTGVSDAGMKWLKGLHNLHTLDLRGTQVTDVGVDELRGLRNLRTLSLDRSRVTSHLLRGLREAGLLHALAQAKGRDDQRPAGPDSVTSLDLYNTRVTGDVVKELKELDNLRELRLGSTGVTDEGLKELRALTHLEVLTLDACPGVTDAGMKELAGLSDLRRLTLTGTRAKGPGLRDLRGLDRLLTVDFSRDSVTDDILRNLNSAGMIHTLSTASAQTGRRPTGPAGVVALDVFSARGFTDAGLKEIRAFRNLQYLTLGGNGGHGRRVERVEGLRTPPVVGPQLHGGDRRGVEGAWGIKGTRGTVSPLDPSDRCGSEGAEGRLAPLRREAVAGVGMPGTACGRPAADRTSGRE
jgi:internalin A